MEPYTAENSQPSWQVDYLALFHLVRTSGFSLQHTHSRSGIALPPCHASTSNTSEVLLKESLFLDPETHFTAKEMKTMVSWNSLILWISLPRVNRLYRIVKYFIEESNGYSARRVTPPCEVVLFPHTQLLLTKAPSLEEKWGKPARFPKAPKQLAYRMPEGW